MQPGAELLLLRACLGVGDGADRVVWHAFAQWLWLADGAALSTTFGRLAAFGLCAGVGSDCDGSLINPGAPY